MARWCFTMPVSSGTRGTSPASKSCAREHKTVLSGTPPTRVREAAQGVLHLLLARQRQLVARRVERGLHLAAAAQAEHGHDAVDGLPARARRPRIRA